MRNAHLNTRAPYGYWHNGYLPYTPNKTIEFVNIIDAFNRKFIFFYNCSIDSMNATFTILLLGRESDANKFMIEFELKHKSRKTKIIENCYNFENDYSRQTNDGDRCIFISKNVMDKFVNNGAINFRLIIKRKDKLEAEDLLKERCLKERGLHCDRSSVKNETEYGIPNAFAPVPVPRTSIVNKESFY